MSIGFSLDLLPPDPLLGLMAMFRADTRPMKVDLGVGIYQNGDGLTPIMRAVKSAEKKLLVTEDTKAYEGPSGNLAYCKSVENLVFGSSWRSVKDRLGSLVTPGGCGAIFLALQLLKRRNPKSTLWASNPTWPNHIGVAQSLNLGVRRYSYVNDITGGIDFDGLCSDLEEAKYGDIIIIQGPCHNPTGRDLSVNEWKTVADILNRNGAIPLIDIAYHGLGAGLEEDISGVIAALDRLELACISYSCSKNFGLYRERTGCLIILSESTSSKDVLLSHLNDIARCCYSMPPAHGAAIVQTVLSSEELRADWELELVEMRARIQSLRSSLASALCNVTGLDAYQAIGREKGMFSQLPWSEAKSNQLIRDHAIYIPGSGRLNIAGLNEELINHVAHCLGQALPTDSVKNII